MESKVSEKDMREVYFQAFGKQYDSDDRKQAPLPLDIAYLVALNKLKREGKYEGGGEITDDIYYQSVNDFVNFCMNYPANFLYAFGSLKNHLANKFKMYYNSYGSYGVMIKFYTELDSKNRRILTDFAYENYDGTNIDLDISAVEYFNSVNHFIFFCFNFPDNFMEAFPSNLRVHLSEKWSYAYNKKGSVGAMIYFWSELSDDNRKRLANWSKENYKGTRLYEAGGLLGEVAGMLPSPLPMSTIQAMANGGSIENNYKDKTEKDIWNNIWNYDQKFHFLSDHVNEIGFDEEFYNERPKSTKRIQGSNGAEIGFRFIDKDKIIDTKYVDLPRYVKHSLQKHIRGGQYADGGGVRNINVLEKGGRVGYYNNLRDLLELRDNGTKTIILNGFRENIGYVIDLKLDDQDLIKIEDGVYETTYKKGGQIELFADGGGVDDCIEYIKNSESIKDNGYYLHIDNMYNYVGSNSLNIPKINSLCLITFNSGGQKNLKAVDTINSILLSSEIAKLLNIDIEIARIIVSEQITFSKPFTMNMLDDIENKNIIIADRDTIVCTNLSMQSNDSEYKSAFNSKQDFLKGKTELERIEDLKKEVSKNKWSREALTEESGIVKVYSRMYDLDKETVASIFNEYQKKYADGGEIVDLFEDYENIPENVQEVLDRYSEKYGEDFSEMDYNDMAEMHKEIEKIGYTFDYGLDNMPYGLRPIGIELNQLRGYEEYGLGGFLLGAGVGALGYKLYLESKTKKGKEKFKRTYNKVKKKIGL
jgi:hypothetical protein